VRAVVDTNVVAYLLLQTEPFAEQCEAFWREVEEPIAPASWEAELVNVLWLAARKKVLPMDEALDLLSSVEWLGIRSVAVSELWHGALIRAYTSGIAAYDALFVELAETEALPLVTFDQGIIKAFPSVAMRPSELMKS